MKILLIDDDEDDYIITRDNLENIEQSNYELHWELSYDHGLQRLLDEKFDICFTDFRLGDRNGIELIKSAIAEGINIPLILLTGQGDKNIDMQAMKVGAVDYLVKGEMSSLLLERTIRYALNNREALLLLKQSETKYRQLFERSLDSIFITNLEHKLIDFNPSFSRLVKIPFEALDGIHISKLFAETKEWKRYLGYLQDDGQVKEFETDMLNYNGSRICCQISTIVRTNHLDEPIGYQSFIHDLTLRKRSEQQLLMAEKLTMTGKMARSIAHEVRNPLTNLRLALDQLKVEIADDNEDALYYMDVILRNSTRIGQLITDMLNSSKPKELQKELHDVRDIMENAIKLITDRIQLKGTKLHRKFQQDQMGLLADAELIKIAFINVMTNAIEAVQDNDGILEVEITSDKKHIQVNIRDNGSGISPENISMLFDPFYTSKQSGMGLGLTSAQNILHSHGGNIEVSSQPGKGTRVSMVLPRGQ
ncbi:MAG: response regulator [Cyclobacteriaceae bacterium]|nr:response regulator [Cyclobacteriaceae bacterium]